MIFERLIFLDFMGFIVVILMLLGHYFAIARAQFDIFLITSPINLLKGIVSDE